MDSPRLFPPKLQLTLHHKFKARTCLTTKTSNVTHIDHTLFVRGIKPNLNWSQIIRSSHNVLCEDRNPLHSAMPFWRPVRRSTRWRGEECTKKGRIRDEHGFQNGQESDASVCQRVLLG